jgi:hypothetical protein
LHSSCFARAYAELGQFEDAWRSIGEGVTAVETTKTTWFEAEVHRVAGEIALMSPEPDVAKVQAHFERALEVSRQQQAKSWELRAAMSLARLRRDQGKVQQARELLAPVYGWFSEGFDTRDLNEAKALAAQAGDSASSGLSRTHAPKAALLGLYGDSRARTRGRIARGRIKIRPRTFPQSRRRRIALGFRTMLFVGFRGEHPLARGRARRMPP